MEMFTYNRIKEMLAKQKKTSKALAVYLGVYEPTVSSWCTNHNQPSIKKLYKIARFLGIEATDLLSPVNEIKKIKK
jgi:transcriptional regulator with XRE-family HTH domain